jgi:hypothetical protein
VAEVWRSQGYQTNVTKMKGDRGIDVEAVRQRPTGNERILIQAKCYSEGNNIGSQEVRRYATLYQQQESVDNVVIVTSSRFTSEGERLAKDLDVDTIDGTELVNIIIDSGAEYEKYMRSGSYKKPKSQQYTKELLKEELSDFLDDSLDKNSVKGKVELHIKWKLETGDTKGVGVIYETRGIINRQFSASLSYYYGHGLEKEKYDSEDSIAEFEKSICNGNGPWGSMGDEFIHILVKKESKKYVEDELNIIEQIITDSGSSIKDINEVYVIENDAR